jgi:septal ring factor EnvC (AmiA/AmiB activator)
MHKTMKEAAQDELNRLEQQANSLDRRIAEASEQLYQMKQDRNQLRQQVGQAQQALYDASREPRLSDHALLRYLERRYNFQSDQIRDEIMTDRVKAMIDFGASNIVTSHGEFRISNKTITTYIGKR